jgi:hypothetical protein
MREQRSNPESSLVVHANTLSSAPMDMTRVAPRYDAPATGAATEPPEPVEREEVAENERPVEADDSGMSATAHVANRAHVANPSGLRQRLACLTGRGMNYAQADSALRSSKRLVAIRTHRGCVSRL